MPCDKMSRAVHIPCPRAAFPRRADPVPSTIRRRRAGDAASALGASAEARALLREFQCLGKLRVDGTRFRVHDHEPDLPGNLLLAEDVDQVVIVTDPVFRL